MCEKINKRFDWFWPKVKLKVYFGKYHKLPRKCSQKKTNRNLLENNVRQKNGLLTLWVEVPRSIFGIKIKIIINLIRLKHVILINSQIYYKL